MSFTSNISRQPSEDPLQKAHYEISQLKADIRKLTDENAKLKTKKGNKNTSTTPTGGFSISDEGIDALGKCFTTMHEVWVDTYAFQKDPPPPCDVETRYSSLENISMGITGELYNFVPPRHHEYMRNHSSFGVTFRAGMTSFRSAAINRVRNNAPVIFGLPPAYFQTDADRNSIPELVTLLKFDPTQQYMFTSPILYANNVKNDRKLFWNPVLPKILKVILFGSSSLSGGKTGGPKTYGEKWGVLQVTPGAIALAAVLARFLLSPDKEFKEIGTVSKIPYGNNFHSYKRIILEHENSPQVQKLFKFYNTELFSKGTVNSNDATETVDLDEELRNAVLGFGIGSDGSDDEENHIFAGNSRATLAEAVTSAAAPQVMGNPPPIVPPQVPAIPESSGNPYNGRRKSTRRR